MPSAESRAAKPLPAVQRPGVSQSKPAAREVELQDLDERDEAPTEAAA
jgi:hypothetical protein